MRSRQSRHVHDDEERDAGNRGGREQIRSRKTCIDNEFIGQRAQSIEHARE